jgi:hypothetical protein
MGGLVQVKEDRWDAWTGGKPKYDWSGLDEPPLTAEDIMQYPERTHSLYAESAAKLQAARRAPLEPKFTASGNLKEFLLQVSERLRNTGMDTIAYVPDPADCR